MFLKHTLDNLSPQFIQLTGAFCVAILQNCVNIVQFLTKLEQVGGDFFQDGDALGAGVKIFFSEVEKDLDFDRVHVNGGETGQKQGDIIFRPNRGVV